MAEKIINKDGIIKQIPVEKLDEYLKLGWKLGRGKAAWNKGLTKETDERVKKYSDAQIGKIVSNETKKKLKKSLTGRKLSKEHIKNRTAAQTGLKRSEAFKDAQRQRAIGHKVSDQTRAKISRALKGHLGHCSEETKQKISKHNASKEFQEYQRNIKIKNGTINTSKPEKESIEMLINFFGQDNIVKYYTDQRYPFECDVYIRPLDLFIEFNYHWTHGLHPFNKNCEIDLTTLKKWQEKAKKSKFYSVAIEVWTIRDTKKFAVAEANNLNYKAFYKKLDFVAWLTTLNT